MTESESKRDSIQISKLRQQAQVGLVDIIIESVRLKQGSILPLTDLEQLITWRDLNARVAGQSIIEFLSSATFPYVIHTFSVTYEQYGAIPTVIIRELVSGTPGTDGVYRTRTDLQPIYDEAADTLTFGGADTAFNGDITIK